MRTEFILSRLAQHADKKAVEQALKDFDDLMEED